MDIGAWWATVHRIANSWTRLSNYTLFFPWAPHPVSLLLISHRYDVSIQTRDRFVTTSEQRLMVRWSHPEHTHFTIMSPKFPPNWLFFRLSLFLMILTVLRTTDQVFCKRVHPRILISCIFITFESFSSFSIFSPTGYLEVCCFISPYSRISSYLFWYWFLL